jgi:hypothetical protein
MKFYLRPDDVLEILPVSRRTLSTWQRSRVVPFFKIGRIVFFKREDIEAALDRYRVAAIGEQVGGRRWSGKRAMVRADT